MKMKITASSVRKLEGTEKPYEIYDTTLSGFLVRVQPTGGVTYYFRYRNREGVEKRYRIGRAPGVTASVARRTAEEVAGKVAQGVDPQRVKQIGRAEQERIAKETLGAFIEDQYASWAESHQVRGEETLKLLKYSFSHFYARRMSEISQLDIDRWRVAHKAKLKPATINRRVTVLKAVLNRAVAWGVISVNPIAQVKPLRVDHKSRIRYLSVDEEVRLRRALNDREAEIRQARDSANEWRHVRNYEQAPALSGAFVDHLGPMVILCLNTGLRRGEIFDLRWEDVDLVKKRLTVEGSTAKNGQSRYIPLNSEALGILRNWKQQSGDPVHGLVFPSPQTGKRFDNIKKSWEGLRVKAGLKDFLFHDLRHTFASKLVMAGENLYVVKELLGHSTIQMTERYAHLAPEHHVAAVERLVS